RLSLLDVGNAADDVEIGPAEKLLVARGPWRLDARLLPGLFKQRVEEVRPGGRGGFGVVRRPGSRRAERQRQNKRGAARRGDRRAPNPSAPHPPSSHSHGTLSPSPGQNGRESGPRLETVVVSIQALQFTRRNVTGEAG